MKRAKTYGQSRDAVLRTHIELSRALLKIRAKESAWLNEQGLTLPQFAILESLFHLGNLSVGEITKLILSTPGNITVVIRNLQSKGLICSASSDRDKRIKELAITEAGRELMESIFPQHVSNLCGWYETALTEEEIQMLSILLRKLEKSQ